MAQFTRHLMSLALFAAGAMLCASADAGPPKKPRGAGEPAPLGGPRGDADSNATADDRDDAPPPHASRDGRRRPPPPEGEDGMPPPPPEDDGEGFPPPEPGARPMRPGEPGEPGGPRGDRPGGRFRDMLDRQLPAGLVADMMDVLNKHFPDMHARLEQARTANPAEFERRLRRLRPFVMRILQASPELRELIVEDQKLQMQIDERLRQHHDAPAADGAALRDELRPLLDRQFDLRMEKHRRLIADIEERLESQKAVLQKRLSGKERMIEQRLGELTSDQPDDLRWPEP